LSKTLLFRKFNAAITRHLPLAFQQQRKALLEKAKRLYKAKKKIRRTIVDSECCLFADDEQVFADWSRWLCRFVTYYKLLKFLSVLVLCAISIHILSI